MRCALINPPFQDPSAPTLGLAYVAAALDHTAQAVLLEDLNLDLLDYLEKVGASTMGGDPEGGPLRVSVCRFDPKREAGDPRGYMDGYRRQAGALASCTRSGSPWRFWQYGVEHVGGWSDLRSVVEAALDPAEPVCGWLRASPALQRIVQHRPEWIGISVSFEGQLHLALAIAHYLSAETGAAIVLGGGLLNTFAAHLGPQTPLWRCVDGIVLGAGEHVVGRITGAQPRSAPDGVELRWPRRDRWICDVRQTRRPPPRPDFDGFPLSRYRSAGIVLPYRVFSRCHWQRCTFCADAGYCFHTDAHGAKLDAVVVELQELAERHNADGIYFLDAELPASFMLGLSQRLNRGRRLLWGANTRVDEELSGADNVSVLREGGCRFLRFGLESGSQRVLDEMRKGIRLEVASRVLQSVSDAGLATHVYLMRGYGSETEDDWSRTVGFVHDHASWIDMVSVSRFQPYEGSPLVKRSPTRFAVAADDEHWEYPQDGERLADSTAAAGGGESGLVEELLRLRGTSRAFPTPADTILLSERMSLDYRQRMDHSRCHP